LEIAVVVQHVLDLVGYTLKPDTSTMSFSRSTMEEPVGLHHRDVAGVEPAVADRQGGFGRRQYPSITCGP
jgi:hypothetical protein